MAVSYINPEEFNKQLTEKKLSVETLAELLKIEISIAKDTFAGYKSISDFDTLKLHELAGFSYSHLLTKQKTRDVNIQVKPRRSRKSQTKLKETYINIYKKANCEECNFVIYNPVYFCPYCGELLPPTIRQDTTIPDKVKSSDE